MGWAQDTCLSVRDPGPLRALILITSCRALGWGCLGWQRANMALHSRALHNQLKLNCLGQQSQQCWVQGNGKEVTLQEKLGSRRGKATSRPSCAWRSRHYDRDSLSLHIKAQGQLGSEKMQMQLSHLSPLLISLANLNYVHIPAHMLWRSNTSLKSQS